VPELTDHVIDRLSDLIDGELTPGDRDMIEAHLDQCPGCRRVYDELRQTVSLLHNLPKPRPRSKPQPDRNDSAT
jgi:anti-sigma factor RsiW